MPYEEISMKIYRLHQTMEMLFARYKNSPQVAEEDYDLYRQMSDISGWNQGKSIKDKWQPFSTILYPSPEKYQNTSEESANITLTNTLSSISEKFYQDFFEELVSQGEFLSAYSQDGTFYEYHFSKLADEVIDKENCAASWNNITTKEYAHEIYCYHFHADKLTSINGIFIMYASPDILCTDTFKEKFARLGYQEIDFEMIWDSENPDYHDERWGEEQWLRIKFSNLTFRQRQARGISEESILPLFENAEKPTLEPLSPEDIASIAEVTDNAYNLVKSLTGNDVRQAEPRVVVENLSACLTILRARARQADENYLADEQEKHIVDIAVIPHP